MLPYVGRTSMRKDGTGGSEGDFRNLLRRGGGLLFAGFLSYASSKTHVGSPAFPPCGWDKSAASPGLPLSPLLVVSSGTSACKYEGGRTFLLPPQKLC